MYSQEIIDRSRAKLEAALGLELREYSLDEVEEFAFRLKDVDWTVQGIVESLPEDVQQYIVNELHMSKINFRYWATRYCKILSTAKQLIPLSNLWPSQEKLLELMAELEPQGKQRIILLKSRQIGGTAIAEALIAHAVFLQPKTQAIVASDHPDNSLKLWQTLMRMHESLPGWMRPLVDAKPKAQNLHLSGLESDIVYGSGNQRTTLGQGMTVDVCHLTEVSAWIPECTIGIDSDLFPAFESSEKPHSFIILESTGAGARGNWFHDQYDAAARNKSRFKSIFIAWFMRPGWRVASEGVTLADDTKAMGERVLRETGLTLEKDQLAWWQVTKQDYMAKDMLEVFYQEYPSTVEEAFQTGLRSVFSIETRAKVRDGLKVPKLIFDYDARADKWSVVDVDAWLKDEKEEKYDGKFIIWEPPRPGFIYTIGVDASYGITGGDNAAVEVLRVGNRREGDEQVAEWSGCLDPVSLANVCWKVGHYFRDKIERFPALMAIEVNPGSPGIVTQTELMKRNYPNFFIWRKVLRMDGRQTREVGWWTTPATRPLITERGVNGVKKGDLQVNSVAFVKEMGSYVDNGRPGQRHYEHAPGYHDDRIMALFIALEVSHADDRANLADERRRVAEQRKAPPEKVVQFQSMGLTWEECMAKFEEQVIDPFG